MEHVDTITLNELRKEDIRKVEETGEAFYFTPKAKGRYDQTMYRKDKRTGVITVETVSGCIIKYKDYEDPDNCIDVTGTYEL